MAAPCLSRLDAASLPEYEEELRPWVRHFIKLVILLALLAAGYYVYEVSGVTGFSFTLLSRRVWLVCNLHSGPQNLLWLVCNLHSEPQNLQVKKE